MFLLTYVTVNIKTVIL